MNLNLQEIMDERIAVHQDKIAKINKEKSNLKISKVIEFKTADFNIIGEPPKGRSVMIEQLSALDDCKMPVVYVFELPTTTDKKALLDKFQEFRSRSSSEDPVLVKRACAQLHSDSYNSESNILYVGSKRKAIKDRIKQHLGYGPAGTYAMHLTFWFPADIKLKLHIVEIENEDILTEVEAALATKLKPLIGKVEK